MFGVVLVAVIVPVAMLLVDYSASQICGRLVAVQEAFYMRVRALLSWAASLVIVGAAIWQVRRCGYSRLDRRLLWGVFGMWKLMALGFALSIGVPCWESYGRPISVTGTAWEGAAMVLTLAMWVVLLFSLVVLIVVGPRDPELD